MTTPATRIARHRWDKRGQWGSSKDRRTCEACEMTARPDAKGLGWLLGAPPKFNAATGTWAGVEVFCEKLPPCSGRAL